MHRARQRKVAPARLGGQTAWEGKRRGQHVEPIETLCWMCAPRHRRSGTTAALPSVTCIARSASDVLARDAENVASVLRMIQLQDDLALPIDLYVLSRFAVSGGEMHDVGWLR
jgi:hypothetical protein